MGRIGLGAVAPDRCYEAKRFYVLSSVRGLGLGRAMTEAVEEAGRRGYREPGLDTRRHEILAAAAVATGERRSASPRPPLDRMPLVARSPRQAGYQCAWVMKVPQFANFPRL